MGCQGSFACRACPDTGTGTSEDVFNLLAIRGPTRRGEGKPRIEPGSPYPRSSPLPLKFSRLEPDCEISIIYDFHWSRLRGFTMVSILWNLFRILLKRNRTVKYKQKEKNIIFCNLALHLEVSTAEFYSKFGIFQNAYIFTFTYDHTCTLSTLSWVINLHVFMNILFILLLTLVSCIWNRMLYEH